MVRCEFITEALWYIILLIVGRNASTIISMLKRTLLALICTTMSKYKQVSELIVTWVVKAIFRGYFIIRCTFNILEWVSEWVVRWVSRWVTMSTLTLPVDTNWLPFNRGSWRNTHFLPYGQAAVAIWVEQTCENYKEEK